MIEITSEKARQEAKIARMTHLLSEAVYALNQKVNFKTRGKHKDSYSICAAIDDELRGENG